MNTYAKAIKLEQDGASYYEEQAKLHPDTAISKIFLRLAEAERRHEAAIKNFEQGQGFGEQVDTDMPSLFTGKGDVKSEVRPQPDELEVYLDAAELEQKSISMYRRLLKEATDEHEKALLNWLIDEERRHYVQLDELAEMIRHGDEYVTHAMFANPPEY